MRKPQKQQPLKSMSGNEPILHKPHCSAKIRALFLVFAHSGRAAEERRGEDEDR